MISRWGAGAMQAMGVLGQLITKAMPLNAPVAYEIRFVSGFLEVQRMKGFLTDGFGRHWDK